jgi:hypothetical protein
MSHSARSLVSTANREALVVSVTVRNRLHSSCECALICASVTAAVIHCGIVMLLTPASRMSARACMLAYTDCNRSAKLRAGVTPFRVIMLCFCTVPWQYIIRAKLLSQWQMYALMTAVTICIACCRGAE